MPIHAAKGETGGAGVRHAHSHPPPYLRVRGARYDQVARYSTPCTVALVGRARMGYTEPVALAAEFKG
jgi:hypothetical protein